MLSADGAAKGARRARARAFVRRERRSRLNELRDTQRACDGHQRFAYSETLEYFLLLEGLKTWYIICVKQFYNLFYFHRLRSFF